MATLVAAVLLGAGGCASVDRGGATGTASSAGSAQADLPDAYCTSNGGVVQTRYPYFNTNNSDPKKWLPLSGFTKFCQFTSPQDGSRILVQVGTLYTRSASLAASAYLMKPAYTPSPNPNVNPASMYCSELGGSDQFGGMGGSGGWALEGPTDAVQMCVLPDLSIIDSFGVFYHTSGTIRGRDLTHVFNYAPPGGQTAAPFAGPREGGRP